MAKPFVPNTALCADCHEPSIAIINGMGACSFHARILTPNDDILDVCPICGQTWNPSESGEMTCPNAGDDDHRPEPDAFKET